MLLYICRGGLLLLLSVSLWCCEKRDTTDLTPDAESFELDFSNLNLDLELDFTYDFGYNSPAELNRLVEKVLTELDSDANTDVNWVDFNVQEKATTIVFSDKIPDNYDKAKGCDESGYTSVGNGRCYSKECVSGRVTTAFENTPDSGECLDVRVDRGGLGVRVCWKVSSC